MFGKVTSHKANGRGNTYAVRYGKRNTERASQGDTAERQLANEISKEQGN